VIIFSASFNTGVFEAESVEKDIKIPRRKSSDVDLKFVVLLGMSAVQNLSIYKIWIHYSR